MYELISTHDHPCVICHHSGDLRRVRTLRFWGLYDVLVEKYHFLLEEASGFSDFLLCMLDYHPERRATAAQCLCHPWLTSWKLPKGPTGLIPICSPNRQMLSATGHGQFLNVPAICVMLKVHRESLKCYTKRMQKRYLDSSLCILLTLICKILWNVVFNIREHVFFSPLLPH